MPEIKEHQASEEVPATCPHLHGDVRRTLGPCPLCIEIERLLRGGEVPY